MKKYLLSMMVMAVFAIGFAASGEDDDDVWITDDGKKYYKKQYICTKCGAAPEYAREWVSEDGKDRITNPDLVGFGGLRSNYYNGKFYCTTCILEMRK